MVQSIFLLPWSRRARLGCCTRACHKHTQEPTGDRRGRARITASPPLNPMCSTADGGVGHQSAAGHPAARGWELVSAAVVSSSVAAMTGRAAAPAAFPAEASVADPELLASHTGASYGSNTYRRRLSPASALQQYSRPGVHKLVPGTRGGLKMAYRHIIGDAALLATIGLMAAIIGGAF